MKLQNITVALILFPMSTLASSQPPHGAYA